MSDLKFKMKNHNEVDTILVIKVKKCTDVTLCHSHCIEKMLSKFQHLGIKEASTPCDISCELSDNPDGPVTELEYARVINSLIYIMYYTRP